MESSRSTTGFILPLSSKDADLPTVGGKGANLAELARAGFPVPDAFLIATDAYRSFVESNRIQQRIVDLAGRASPEDPGSLEETSAAIRALFGRWQMPAAVARQIATAYRDLSGAEGEAPIAVRSSATAEDLPGLSFAGQQESYLNVVGTEAVLEAVRRCWSSLWTARALGYRARNGIPSQEVALAVVVQRLIAAETSGVLFTANPLTGRRDEIAIDASFGLGEAVVAGQVEPDHYVISATEWRITTRRLGSKGLAIVPRPGGGTEQTPREAAGEQAMPEERILELARLGQRVAEHFGSPQDVEWAWAGGQFHLLQSRPITSLYPLPDLPTPPDSPRLYLSFNALQGVTEPFTLLGRYALQRALAGFPRFLGVRRPAHELLPAAGGRLFLDATALARDPSLRHLLMALLTRGDPVAGQIVAQLVEEGRLPPRHALTPGRGIALARAVAPMLGRAVLALLFPERASARAVAKADRFLGGVRQRAQEARDLPARLAALGRDLDRAVEVILPAMLPVVFPAIAAISLVDRWLVRWASAAPGASLALLRGLPGNVTTEMDLKLWAAAQQIRADPRTREALQARSAEALAAAYRRGELPAVAQQSLRRFLEQYGMRAPGEIDLGRPRWRDDPAPLLQTLLGYLQLEDPDLAPDALFRQGAAEAERIAAGYLARVRKTRFGSLRAWLLGGAIRRMRVLGRMRESPKLYLIKIMDEHRRALLESTRDLVGRGDLERPEDVFFVPFQALQAFTRGEAVDLRGLAATGRADYERERRRRQLPRVLLSTGEAFYGGPTEAGEGDLVGDPVSPGVVEGPVRVVLDPRGARIQPGEILVCPATDPGWTPLFLTAGGLVMEMGGLVTHGSVVAREYGIPAVVGVHEATVRLKTGQRVRVDGNLGRVTMLD